MGKPASVKRSQSTGASKRRSVGAYGSKRGVPDKQVHRARVREADPRVQQAKDEAERVQRRLEQRIAREQYEPSTGATPGALYVREQAVREALAAREREEAARVRHEAHERSVREHRFEPWEGEGKNGWGIADARKMLRAGYTVRHVMRISGVGYRWLNDIELDEDYRGHADAS